jgi:ribosomal protein S18 acetylase RimI-like enzyme
MLLSKEQTNSHLQEIGELYRTHIDEELVSGLIHFGIFEQTLAGEVIKAIASIKNYDGRWFLWGCVVKLEYRGQGLQKQLVNERLEYLRTVTDTARVYVEPWNDHSIKNLESLGFEYEGQTIHEDGYTTLFIYKLGWNQP